MPKIERIIEDSTISEGPHWDAASQSLFFIELPGQTIVKYTPSTKKLTKSTFEKQPTFIIPLEGKKDEFIISLGNELATITWNGENESAKIIQKICAVETSVDTPITFNDAKCDSSGRLWTGTFSRVEDFDKTPPLASIYSVDAKKQLKRHVDKIHCSNGIAFNDKTKKMFYNDSLVGSVDQFDFDIASGTISNRKSWFTLQKFGIPGVVDGLTIDSEGNLWVAIFGANRVLKIDGYKSETLLDTVNMPTEEVTSVAFGGPNLDELYVTTACIEYKGKKPSVPVAGATYRVTGVNAKGVPAANFKLTD